MHSNVSMHARALCTLGFVVALLASAGIAPRARAQDHDDDHEHETVRDEIHDETHGGSHWGHPRLRLGISGQGGGFFGAVHGGLGGLALRVGVQLDDMVAIYVQGQGLIGEFLPDPLPTSLTGFAFHELMVDVTLLDMIQLGVGPSLDVIWGCAPENDGRHCRSNGPFFGGDLRAAIVLGGRSHARRHGFVLSVDAHATWFEHEAVGTMLFGLGGELY